MKTFFLILISIFFYLQGNSQEMYVRDLFDFYREQGSPQNFNIEKKYEDIAGSPYLQNNFIEGTVVRINGDTYKKIPLRYNGYNDRMEFRPPSKVVMYVDNPEEFSKIKIGTTIYIYLPKNNKKQEDNGYFELIEDGKIKLLKKHSISMKAAEASRPYQEPKPATFDKNPTKIYILNENKDIVEINNDKNLLEALILNTQAIKSYIKKKKLKVRKEEDLQKVIGYYNTL